MRLVILLISVLFIFSCGTDTHYKETKVVKGDKGERGEKGDKGESGRCDCDCSFTTRISISTPSVPYTDGYSTPMKFDPNTRKLGIWDGLRWRYVRLD